MVAVQANGSDLTPLSAFWLGNPTNQAREGFDKAPFAVWAGRGILHKAY